MSEIEDTVLITPKGTRKAGENCMNKIDLQDEDFNASLMARVKEKPIKYRRIVRQILCSNATQSETLQQKKAKT